MRLADGTIFAERYRIERCIGGGAMGAVYEVTHLETERRRALKVMRAEIVQREDLRKRFREEAKVGARVDSEHIVDVLDAGVDAATGLPFLAMELLVGESLDARIARGPIPADEALAYLRQVALALDKSHQARIVHRDLKPENLFLVARADGTRQVKVLDFGIAKFLEGTAADAKTRSLGTPLFMAPEQFRGGQPVSAQADVYALGMVVFAMLVGSPYWLEEAHSEETVSAFLAAALTGPVEPPVPRARRRGIELPPEFDAWFARATALEPSQRFASVGEAVAALAIVLEPALPTAASPSSLAYSDTIVSVAPQDTVATPAATAAPAIAPGVPPLATTMASPQPRRTPVYAIAGIAAVLIAGAVLVWMLADGDRDGRSKKKRRASDSAAVASASAPPSAEPAGSTSAEPETTPSVEPAPAPEAQPGDEPDDEKDRRLRPHRLRRRLLR